MANASDIEVHFSRMGAGGGMLAIVAVGTDVYGATDMEPTRALQTVAMRAAEDLARRGRPIDVESIVEVGLGNLPIV